MNISAQIFLWALVLNFVWEVAHSRLYAHFWGGPIGYLILIGAAVLDGLAILAMIYLVRRLFPDKYRLGVLVVGGIGVAVVVERVATALGLWEYRPAMPIVPVLNTGLTPTVQLGLLAGVVFWIVFKRRVV